VIQRRLSHQFAAGVCTPSMPPEPGAPTPDTQASAGCGSAAKFTTVCGTPTGAYWYPGFSVKETKTFFDRF
jgi:hypothetical protein